MAKRKTEFDPFELDGDHEIKIAICSAIYKPDGYHGLIIFLGEDRLFVGMVESPQTYPSAQLACEAATTKMEGTGLLAPVAPWEH